MSKTATPLADSLLEAHVKHEMAALKGAKLKKFLQTEVAELYDRCSQVTLNRVTSVDQIMGVIQRIVMDMELDPGIPELAAEMAAEVLKSPVQGETRLKEIITREQASAFLEEALELRHQRERIISEIMAHPVYQELVSNVVYHGLVNYLYEDNLITKNVPGVGSMMKFGKNLANRAVKGLDEAFERRIKAWLSDSLPALIARSETFLNKALTDEELRDSVMAAWVSLEDKTIEDLHAGIGEVQLQEFVLLGYEFWLTFRQTGYFEEVARVVVIHLFEKYGDRPLIDLMSDVGVDQAVIIKEVEELGIPLVDLLREEGYLEAALRRRLEPFYKSAPVKKILDGGE